MQVRYPYDPTGLDDGNIIKGERFSLSSLDNTFRCIVPQLAPFFRHGLQVVHWPSGKELTEGKDYYLVSHSNLSSEIADLPLFGIIAFINPELAGEIEVKQYRTIGGNWIDVHKAVFEKLANYLTDPAQVSWVAVLDELDALPAIDHDQHWNDFTNTNAIAAAINRITAAMQTKSETAGTSEISALEQRLIALQDLVASTEFDKHIIDVLNPHSMKASDVLALPAGDTAVDAFKMFGMELLEFVDFIKSKQFSTEDYKNYLAKYDATSTDFRFELEDGQAVIGNSTLQAAISIDGFAFNVKMMRGGRLGADMARGIAGKTVTLQAAKNTLKIVSKGPEYDEDSLLINDKIVIHIGNIRRHINNFTAGYFYATVSDSATVDISGDGSDANPIRLEALYNTNPQAAHTIGMIATSYGASTSLYAASSLLAGLASSFVGFVPKTRLVCGHALSGDVTITNKDIGLGNADNTADIDKPVSLSQQLLLDSYSEIDHIHTLDELNVPYSTYESEGILYLKSANFGQGDAVTPSVFKDVVTKLNNWRAMMDTMVDADAIAIMALYTGTEVTSYLETLEDPTYIPTVTEQWSFVVGGDGLMCYNGQIYTAIGETFSMYTLLGKVPPADTETYLYAKVNNDDTHTFSYIYSKELLGTTDTRILAAVIKPGATSVETLYYPSMQSFGDVADIADHIADYDAHQVELPFNALNIRMIDDKTTSHSISPLSPWSLANDSTTVFLDKAAAGVMLGVDMSEGILTVDTASMGANATAWKYGVMGNVNMWDHVTELDATYLYAELKMLVHHKVTSDSQLDVAARAICPILGGMTNALGQTSAIIMAPAGSASDTAPYRTIMPYLKFSDRGTVSTFTGTYQGGDPYDMEVGLGANAGVTPVLYTVQWRINRATGARSIAISGRFGELKNKGDFLSAAIYENDLTLASHLEAFASGKFGWAIGGHGQSKIWTVAKLNQDGDRYASTNMLIEAMATNTKLKVLIGVASAGCIPMPAGCSKALVIKTINSWTAADPLTDMYSLSWWRSGNNNADSINEIYMYGSTDPLWRLVQGTMVSINAGVFTNNPATVRYMVLGIPNPIEVNLT